MEWNASAQMASWTQTEREPLHAAALMGAAAKADGYKRIINSVMTTAMTMTTHLATSCH